MRYFEPECNDSLSSAELSELLIGYAQENEFLKSEIERLTRKCASLEQSAAARLEYIRSVRDAEAAVRHFVTSPAIAPYIPSRREVWDRIMDGPVSYAGDPDD